MYPFTNDIGKMKVSKALPLLEYISAEWNLNLAVLPNNASSNGSAFISKNNAFKIAYRILKNSSRNN